jgi:exodeoxyribonuclease V alpha subunit
MKANIYNSFQQASQNLCKLTPVDYFLAVEITQSLNQLITKSINEPFTKSLSQSIRTVADSEVFHLIIALSMSLQNGNTCLPLSAIANQRFAFESDEQGNVLHQGYIFSPFEVLIEKLQHLSITSHDQQLVVFHHNALYLRRYFVFEQELMGHIQTKLIDDQRYSLNTIKTVVNGLFPSGKQGDNNAVDWQKVAVVNALNKNFTVIAGGPGTGKTYTVTKLLAAIVSLEMKVSLAKKSAQQLTKASACDHESSPNTRLFTKADTKLDTSTEPLTTKFALVAPTGKAAQRLSESIKQAVNNFTGSIDQQILDNIPNKAQTIHRLLGVISHEPNFRHNQNNLLNIDFLLIDEVSMVDLALMNRIFRALPAHTKVVLLGDADQLPAVAAGNVLADIAPRPHTGYSPQNQQYLQSITDYSPEQLLLSKPGKDPSLNFADYLTILSHSRRFDGEGGIGKIAKAIIASQADISWQLLENCYLPPTQQQALQLIHDGSHRDLVAYITQYYQVLFKTKNIVDVFKLFGQFRILCATRQGKQGVEYYNDLVKTQLINKGIIPAYQEHYHGMPIMIAENHHKLGVFNGDIGFLWRDQQGHLTAMFEDADHGFKTIIVSRLPKFEPVYAMTIHKTQGSEFDHVYMVLPAQKDNKLLSRELLYTGITRAKKYLSVDTRENVWRQAVETKVVRHSNFKLT